MNKLNKKIILFLMGSFLVINPIYAGCGSCQGDNKNIISKKSSSLVTTIPESGSIEGFVISSCGICNFDYKKIRRCSLTIKIDDKIYPVEGTKIHDHGNPHSEEGFCNVIRIAYVSGKIKNDKFFSDSFTLIESPE